MGNNLIYIVIGMAIVVASLTQAGNLLAWGVGLTAQEPAQTSVAAVERPDVETGDLKTEEFLPTAISAPAIGLDLTIVSSPLVNGTWEVFDGVANFAEGTSLVSAEGGNVGLFAHDRKNGFTEIKNLSQGDVITLYGEDKKAEYRVVNTTIVTPSDVSVYNPTERPTVTLITCDGFFSEKRYMVQAELVEITDYE